MAHDTLRPDWFERVEVQYVMDMCRTARVPFCFVGGAVRDALCCVTPNDFDMLMGCAPEETEALLAQTGVAFERIESRNKVKRTRINDMQFDFIHLEESVSSLSFDKAVAHYTGKADFTINAMALFPDGRLHDTMGGRGDLSKGKVRFIEDPKTKIRSQPHLPLPLRFFRHYACFGRGRPDRAGFEASVALAHTMKDIKRRGIIMRELYKLLLAPKPFKALALMHQHGVFPYVLGFSLTDTGLLESLQETERLRKEPSPWQVRLALLLLSADVAREEDALSLMEKYLEMDAGDMKHFHHLLEYYAALDVPMPAWERDGLIKRLGKETVRNLFLLSWALEDDAAAAGERYRKALEEIT